MDRSDCQMCHSLDGKIYCSYYDCLYQQCKDVAYGQCPRGLDNDDDYYRDNEYEEENWQPIR